MFLSRSTQLIIHQPRTTTGKKNEQTSFHCLYNEWYSSHEWVLHGCFCPSGFLFTAFFSWFSVAFWTNIQCFRMPYKGSMISSQSPLQNYQLLNKLHPGVCPPELVTPSQNAFPYLPPFSSIPTYSTLSQEPLLYLCNFSHVSPLILPLVCLCL